MNHPAAPFHDARQPSKARTRAASGLRTLRLGLLGTLVIGSMIGSGLFSLPHDMAAGALGWLIAGVGMPMLALVYQTQTRVLRKPAFGNGVYAYARVGAGQCVGFHAARGERVSARIAAATR